MKKLMCAMAAIAAGVAMADVTSANIVGYQNKELQDNKQALSSGFVAIGEKDAGFWLTSVMPVYDGQVGGDIYIERLNDAGVTIESYSFMQGVRGKEDGWYNDDDELIGDEADDIFFNAGEGLWVTGLEDGVLPFSGEVFDADKEIPLADNKQMLANPYPCDLPLSTNIQIDYDEQVGGDIYIEKLNDAGVTIESYSWMQGVRGKEDGWYNDDDELIGDDGEEVVFPACTGLWVTGLDGAKFQITSPLK